MTSETTNFAFEVKVKIWKYYQGLTVETNTFAFEAKVIPGLESTCPDG